MKKNLLLAAGVSVLSLSAQAEQFWADNSFSLLYGDNYKMVPAGENTRATVMTLEHVSGHSWGGMFFFIDRVNSGEGAYDETYGELSPSISLAKFDGFVKGINAAFTYEFSSSTTSTASYPYNTFSQDNYLAGVGVDLAIPGADYFSATVYRSKNNTSFDSFYDNQLTLVYGWSLGNVTLDGYLDYTPGRNGRKTELSIAPQLTYNIGPMLGLKNKVKVGIEYSYWRNKFATPEDNDDQHNASLLLKWHL
ncbi:hypothetical protein GJQ55_11815 [Venatoribacter cucullus]|uniref:Nucleoside-binding outer membrane protein n=1 Tax=Venatoribacter cucullus TaxID=2661630 RepID=A0A9X7UXZ3_9GAMM|nr:hypothetical protein [Venatoribacter cucullus]QQD25117.1 hypothetical protein GJQ55_11815 [Venatoribacter cucullus]